MTAGNLSPPPALKVTQSTGDLMSMSVERILQITLLCNLGVFGILVRFIPYIETF